MTFDTDFIDNAEFVQVRLSSGDEDDGEKTVHVSFSLSVSDLATVVCALEKVRDDDASEEAGEDERGINNF